MSKKPQQHHPRFSADEVKSGLQKRIEDLCVHLLPAGKSDETHWIAGSVLGDKGQSLRIMLHKGDAGRWKDFSSGEAGNVLGLVKAVLYPDDRKWDRTLQWCSWWLGWADASPEEVSRLREETARRREQAEKDAEDRHSRNRAAARRIFFGKESVPRIDGTPAEAYLRGRGIDPGYWSDCRPGWPRSLRYIPELLHGKSGLMAPALVAAITDNKGETIAIHRTWLEDDGQGGWRKVADLGREAKMTLGSYKEHGGYIRLRRGATGKPWQHPDPGETVYVTEGIEDALTLAMALPDKRIACAVSLSSLANARFPEGIQRLVIVADNDGAENRGAQMGLQRAIEAQRRNRLKVAIMRPPEGVKDLNDWLKISGAEQ